ncbi:MAG: sigma-70 family RNA polymerase sigma factor [Anaerolineae bacterium]|nr:sigma-70 family RNA polymerase sigma factor [Anaerolineae bacterium]
MFSSPSAVSDPLTCRLLPQINADAADRHSAWSEYLAAGPQQKLAQYIAFHNHTATADEDILQETLVVAYVKVEAGEYAAGSAPFVAWLKAIARFKILEAARHHEFAPLEDFEELLPDSRAEQHGVDGLHLRSELASALDALPARRKDIVLLSELLDYSSDEIAAMLHIRADLVRKDKSLALQQLRRQVPPELLDEARRAA